MGTEDIAFIRAMLHGLLVECPLGGNPADCQVYAIRKQSMRERVAWLKSLSDEECRAMYARHRSCLAEHEGCGDLRNPFPPAS